jgi:exosortase H (IPTLxxWG-CTERM-specific)
MIVGYAFWHPQALKRNLQVLRFFFLFLLIQSILFTAELTPIAQDRVIVPFTEGVAAISTWLITLFDPGVVAHGKEIHDVQSGFAVSIEAGCNGIEATIVLLAAIVAFPAPWLHRLWGLIIGFLAIQGLNFLRIISLFYIGQWNIRVFEWAHLYIWQALIMLDVLIIFLLWLRFLPQHVAPGRNEYG